jgi:hypothetical protein
MMRPHLSPVPLLAIAVVAGSLLAAGCGGSPKASVANLTTSSTDTSTTSTGVSAPSPASPSGSGRSGGQFKLAMNLGANGAKFSACMRSHGVPNFPDPNGQGVISIDSGMGIDPGSPKFQSAQTACQKLLPNGGQPTPAQQAQMQQKALAFSACMRRHGLKDFPDPSFSNGKISIGIRAGSGSDLDPSSPKFQAAQQACQGIMGKAGGPATSGSGKSAG